MVFEEAGYSLLGPLAMNCSAPDEGNMHLLEVVATPAQQERFLGPLARGDVRSCFAMTEPAPGAGSDPRMLRTEARRSDGGWVVTGEKWYITGADGAGFAIVMARTAPEITRDGGATMFLVDMEEPGIRVERHIPSLDTGFVGGHCRVVLEELFVPDEDVLGAVDRGYHYAQVRLNPARLTHCMRWLGLARRAQDVAVARVTEREAFGSRLAELGMVQQHLADSEIDLAASRGADRARRLGPRHLRPDARGDGDREGLRGGGRQPDRRPRDPGVRLARRLGRPSAGTVPARGQAVPDLRRAVGGPPVVARPQAREGERRGGAAGMAVAPADDLVDRERLAAWLRERAPRLDGPFTLRRIGEGQSCLTYLIEGGDWSAVLRRPPRGDLPAGAFDVLREHRIMRALHAGAAGVPVPETYGACDDPAVLGAPFYVMEHVRGAVLRDALPEGTTADGLRPLGGAMIDTLVAIHATPVAEVGLGALGRPAGFLERQLRPHAEPVGASPRAERAGARRAWRDGSPRPSRATPTTARARRLQARQPDRRPARVR